MGRDDAKSRKKRKKKIGPRKSASLFRSDFRYKPAGQCSRHGVETKSINQLLKYRELAGKFVAVGVNAEQEKKGCMLQSLEPLVSIYLPVYMCKYPPANQQLLELAKANPYIWSLRPDGGVVRWLNVGW